MSRLPTIPIKYHPMRWPAKDPEPINLTVGELMVELIKHDPNLPVMFGVSLGTGTAQYTGIGGKCWAFTPLKTDGEVMYLLLQGEEEPPPDGGNGESL